MVTRVSLRQLPYMETLRLQELFFFVTNKLSCEQSSVLLEKLQGDLG